MPLVPSRAWCQSLPGHQFGKGCRLDQKQPPAVEQAAVPWASACAACISPAPAQANTHKVFGEGSNVSARCCGFVPFQLEGDRL